MRNAAFILLVLCPSSLAAQAETDVVAEQHFQWHSALAQSFRFLALEHGLRLAGEPETRSQLKGPFWRDYGRSLKGVSGWGDGDPWPVNYVGHPFQGAVSGFIQIQNDAGFKSAEFGMSSRYWRSRLRALAWSAAYSTEFELGPLSEASLGNVGMKRGSAGMVDLVVTPTGGFGVILAEDCLDHFVIKRFEKWTSRPSPRALVRGFLNPNRSLANLLRGKLPWHRDTRPGVTAR